jgi:protease secretion system membrane fusion protein
MRNVARPIAEGALAQVLPDNFLTRWLLRVNDRADGWIQGWNPYSLDRLAATDRDLEPVVIEEATVKKKVARYILIAATLFMIWACVAPIDGGVVMKGNVVVAGYRKAVQHPRGGVVQQILISEGQKVKQGQVLIRINPLETDATLAAVQAEYINILVRESRLRALNSGAAAITWSPELAQYGNGPEIAETKSFQVRLFNARRSQQLEQERALRSQISGLGAAVSAHEVQLRTLNDELKNTRALAKDGFVPMSQVNQTERNKAEQDAAMANSRSTIGQIQAQIAELRSTFAKEISDEASEVQKNREAVISKLQSATFDKNAAEIRAPVSGTIVGLKVYTVGGVISAGETLAEIVPENGKLVVEAQVPATSIDKVKVGELTDLRFSAFNIVTTPVVEGKVVTVGVDRLKAKPGEEVKQEEDYYLAQIETTEEAQRKLKGLTIQPGMPVDVIVKTGQRTFMSYLLKPLTDRFALAFKS